MVLSNFRLLHGTSYCLIKGSSFPRILILTPDKREITYDMALTELKKFIPSVNYSSNVMTGYMNVLYTIAVDEILKI